MEASSNTADLSGRLGFCPSYGPFAGSGAGAFRFVLKTVEFVEGISHGLKSFGYGGAYVPGFVGPCF